MGARRKVKRDKAMKPILMLTALLALTACAGGSGGPDNSNEFYPNCEEQSDWAKNGRTDGREIIITCP
jgi:hypothetical protein